MKAKLPLTEAIKMKIQTHIKNKMDISDFVEQYNIKGQNLSNAVIKRVNMVNEDLSNTNFVNCLIGEEKKTVSFINCDLKGCNFRGAVFPGEVLFRHCDMRNATMKGAFLPFAEYRYSDLRNVSFCEAVIRIGSKNCYKAKFEWKQFVDMANYFEMDLIK